MDEPVHELRIQLLGGFQVSVGTRPMASPLGQLAGALRREQRAVQLDLERLGPRESDLLVAAHLGGAPVDRAILDAVRRAAAGNPFYSEEILRSLQETARLQQAEGRWRLLGEDVPLPGHVFDLLAGRMERLGAAAVQVLSLAAVAGQEACYPVLLSRRPSERGAGSGGGGARAGAQGTGRLRGSWGRRCRRRGAAAARPAVARL